MKPGVDIFLQVATVHLMSQTAQAVGPGYEQSNTMALGALLTAVQQEFERAAARRAEENAALRALFADAAAVVSDSALAKRLTEAAGGKDQSLLVSDLERANARMRSLLIDLQAHVEELDTPEARRIEEAIWAELVASTDRRRLAIGAF